MVKSFIALCLFRHDGGQPGRDQKEGGHPPDRAGPETTYGNDMNCMDITREQDRTGAPSAARGAFAWAMAATDLFAYGVGLRLRHP